MLRSRFQVARAQAEDEAGIRGLLRSQAMGGAVRLAFARDPDLALASGVEGERHHGVVVREAESGRVVGFGSRAVREVWLNGERARLGYLGQLRRAPPATGRLHLLAEGFDLLDQTRRDDELPFDLTSILADNATARGLLERGLPRLPIYQPLGRLVTLALRSRRGSGSASPRVRPATAADLPAIAACLQENGRRFQLAPVWTPEDLASEARCRGLSPQDFSLVMDGERVIGCLALWDQRGFKQTVVAGYSPALGRGRRLLNLALAVTGRPRLPRPGSTLALAYLSHLAVDGDREDVALALVRAALALAHRRGLDYGVLALAEGNPLLPVIARHFPARRLESVLYLVRPRHATPTVALDGRPLHVEVATL